MSSIWFLLATAFLVLWLTSRSSSKKEAADRETSNQAKVAALQTELARTQAQRDELFSREQTSQSRAVALDSELAQTRAQRDESVARLRRIEGLGALEDAVSYAAKLHDTAEAEMLRSKLEAERLVSDAQERAREIAGSAYDVAQREAELKKSVRSLENTIKGYGDEYLIPTSTLMDDLEERYGFAESGQKLKDARQLVKTMIRKGTAADCDYVEKNRKETAIAFVLDAFNGKAASALASVKNDNFGKLEQQLKDAYQLVNLHGEAFRSARIEANYLDAQINVLKWAVAVQELRRLEKEEQRALREEMREEEKAKKEYERSMKQAARDETVARKAVDEAQRALLKAGAEEREKLEAKLAALTEKLQSAEDRGKRAMSMAQQTRAGTVYVISNIGSFGEDVFKIGMTRRLEPLDRVKELGDASVPFSFDVHALIRTDDAPALEKELHQVFVRKQVNKVNARKEFFKTPLTQIRAKVEDMGVTASWTMAAACTEWRETIALEKELNAEGEAAKKWEERQVTC